MGRRLAHRPHYRNVQQPMRPLFRTRQHFFSTRWIYRRQRIDYEKRPLGYGLAFVPWGYPAISDTLLHG